MVTGGEHQSTRCADVPRGADPTSGSRYSCPQPLWPLQTFPAVQKAPQELYVSGQMARAAHPAINNSERCCRNSRAELSPKRK